MSNIEDIMYEAIGLNIREKVYKTVRKLIEKNPYEELSNLYNKALSIEKNKLK